MRNSLKICMIGFVAFLFLVSIPTISSSSARNAMASASSDLTVYKTTAPYGAAGYAVNGSAGSVSSVTVDTTVPSLHCTQRTTGAFLGVFIDTAGPSGGGPVSTTDGQSASLVVICQSGKATALAYFYSINSTGAFVAAGQYAVSQGDKIRLSIVDSYGLYTFHLFDITSKVFFVGYAADSDNNGPYHNIIVACANSLVKSLIKISQPTRLTPI